MKDVFIKDLKKDSLINSVNFAVYEVRKAEDKNGKTYYDLLIGDKTGRLKAKIWNDTLAKIDQSIIKTDSILKVTAKVDEFKGNLQMNITNLELSTDKDSMEDFITASEFDLDSIYTELLAEIDAIKFAPLRKVLKQIYSDPEISAKLKTWPAASTVHHAFKGGLMQHISEMLSISKGLKRFYPTANYDLLTTGILLHDIGKIEELDAKKFTTEYTKKGMLMGHISIGVEIFNKFAKDTLPEDIKLHVVHLILSHHGTHEYGSPALPATVEAVMLTYIDDLSAKARTATGIINDIPEEQEFSDYVKWLEGTKLWKGHEYSDESDADNINSDQVSLI